MVTGRKSGLDSGTSNRRTPTTPEGREQQMIGLAHDLAEKRIREGTASAQEITHFLKLGSSRERLEQERLSHENELLVAKRQQIESQEAVEELYKAALGAMRTYSGQEPVNTTDEFDD